MKNTAILLIHCPDTPGIIAEVSNFITVNNGNIVYLDQYVDHANNAFFMRVEWDITDFLIPKERIGEYFDIDPTLVRLGFVALSFLAGGGLLVYIVAAIIIPDKADE